MSQITRKVLVGIVFALSGAVRAFGDEPSLAETVEAQWHRYRQELNRYQMRVTYSHHMLTTGKKRTNFRTLETKRCGDWLLQIQDMKEDGNGAWSVARGINSRYAFEVDKQKSSLPWRLRDIDLDLADGVQIAYIRQMKENTENSGLPFSPYKLPGSGLWILTKRPGFKVTKTGPVASPDGELKKIWFEVAPDEVSAKMTGRVPEEGKGWVVLDPQCYWRVCECEIPYGANLSEPPFKAIAKYQYDFASGNFPLLKQIEIENFNLAGKPLSKSTQDYVFEKRRPSEEEFKLTAFGLPEPTFPKRPSWWSYPYVWLSAAALTCFALALLIRRWKQSATQQMQ